jgi:hypothetical protein
MIRKIVFGLIWLSFILYAFVFSPPDQPETFELIKNMSLGNWEGVNPLILAEFNLMGIWPIIYGCLLFIDGRGQKIRAFPFAIASFFVGAFALLPYLALRQPNPEFTGEKNWFLQVQDSQILGIFITISVIILLGFGIFKGNWEDFILQWQTSRFINVMTLDFCLLSVLFPTILKDDMKRRNFDNNLIYWVVSLIPLLGSSFYLCFRPSLPENK